MTLTLPELPYAMDALAPHMSAETLEYHHGKHHKAYVDTGNSLMAGTAQEGTSNDGLVKAMVTAFNAPGPRSLFNQLGQHFNHIHFWQWMKPGGGGKSIPSEVQALIDQLGGYDEFRGKFIDAGKGQFGSGWVWLVQDPETGGAEIMGTANGENPVVYGKAPLLGCDVWEHSYYIDHRNDRVAYLQTFLDELVNWEHVAKRLADNDLEKV